MQAVLASPSSTSVQPTKVKGLEFNHSILTLSFHFKLMTSYLTPLNFQEIALNQHEYLNNRLNQELYRYCSKRHEEYTSLRDAQKNLSPDAPASHHCIVAEALSQLTSYTFSDGISIPDAWKASYTQVGFAFYLIKVDPNDHKAPLLVEFYFHDERQGHELIPELKHATCYTKKIFRTLRTHNYLAPQYLPLILQNALPCGKDGTSFILHFKHMSVLTEAHIKAPARFQENTIRDLTLFQARRLRTLLIRGRDRAHGNLIVSDNNKKGKKGTSMTWSWGQTQHADAIVYRQTVLPTDATALWARIDRLGYIEPNQQPRGWVELNEERQEDLVAHLDRFIKLVLLNFETEPIDRCGPDEAVLARRKSPQQLLGFPCEQVGHAMKDSPDSPFANAEQSLTAVSKALASPASVAVVRSIKARPWRTAGELTAELPLSLSTVSQHLKELSVAGLVQGETRGSRIRYRLNPTHWTQAQALIGDLCGKIG